MMSFFNFFGTPKKQVEAEKTSKIVEAIHAIADTLKTQEKRKAHLEKQIQFYNGLASNKVREDEKVVAGRLDKIKNDKGETSRRSIYGYADTVDTSVFTQADLKEFRGVVNSAKKQKQKLQDEILELNVQTTIQLTATTETILQAEGLL
jgi:hypothetical protein